MIGALHRPTWRECEPPLTIKESFNRSEKGRVGPTPMQFEREVIFSTSHILEPSGVLKMCSDRNMITVAKPFILVTNLE